jgi:hypothetical protein
VTFIFKFDKNPQKEKCKRFSRNQNLNKNSKKVESVCLNVLIEWMLLFLAPKKIWLNCMQNSFLIFQNFLNVFALCFTVKQKHSIALNCTEEKFDKLVILQVFRKKFNILVPSLIFIIELLSWFYEVLEVGEKAVIGWVSKKFFWKLLNLRSFFWCSWRLYMKIVKLNIINVLTVPNEMLTLVFENFAEPFCIF